MVRFWIATAILCACGFVLYYRYFSEFDNLPRSGRSSSASPARARRRRSRSRGGVWRSSGSTEREDSTPGGFARQASKSSSARTTPSFSTAWTCSSKAQAYRRRRPSWPPRASVALTVWSEVELGLAAPRQPDPRRHRDERQDDDERAPRRDLPRRRPARRRGRERRPAAHRVSTARSPRTPGSSASSRASSSRTSTTFRPRVAVLLNLTPDHLDRHASLEDYRAAKLRIFENQAAEDVAVVPRGFGPIPGDAPRVEFAARRPAAGRAVHPRRAQPRERRRGHGRRARRRDLRTTAIADGAPRASPACRTASSSSARSTASAS